MTSSSDSEAPPAAIPMNVPEPLDAMRTMVSDASEYRSALYRRLLGFVQQYNELRDEDFPRKIVCLNFPQRTWHSREELECSIRELIEILGLKGGYKKKRDLGQRTAEIMPTWGGY